MYTIMHSGSKHSFEARLNNLTKKDIIISNPQKTVTISSKKKIDWFIPSLEGEVLCCYYITGHYGFYCTKTGQQLDEDVVRNMKQNFCV